MLDCFFKLVFKKVFPNAHTYRGSINTTDKHLKNPKVKSEKCIKILYNNHLCASLTEKISNKIYFKKTVRPPGAPCRPASEKHLRPKPEHRVPDWTGLCSAAALVPVPDGEGGNGRGRGREGGAVALHGGVTKINKWHKY